MWLMGTDFRYQYAYSWYRQMDKFIHYVNKVHCLFILANSFQLDFIKYQIPIFYCLVICAIQDGRLNVLYSTPSIYTDAKYAANESWPLKTDDFFP